MKENLNRMRGVGMRKRKDDQQNDRRYEDEYRNPS